MSRHLSQRFTQAVQAASDLHSEQVRKGTTIPYIAHLLAVTAIVLEDGGSEDEAIAALLHDAVEDAGGAATLQQIRGQFGDQVAAIVEACSDTDQEPKPPWHERKREYLRHLEDAPPAVIRVSLADKLHNARAILRDYRTEGDRLWDRFNAKGVGDQLWYYGALAEIFERRRPGVLAEELSEIVAQLDEASITQATSAEQKDLVEQEAVARATAQLPCVCGSTERPIKLKPAPETPAWWEDPSVYLGCASCGRYLEELPIVSPFVWQPDRVIDADNPDAGNGEAKID